MSVTELYLIRHGQSGNNALGDQNLRTADPGLTRTGHAQAKCVAEYLVRETDKTDLRDCVVVDGGHGIQRLYCSAMLRTLQTTEPIAAASGLRPEVWLDVHEEGGIWLNHQDGRGPIGHAGLTGCEIEADFPGFELPEGITEDGWWDRPFETREDLVARAARVAVEVRHRIVGKEERVAIVSHGTFLSLLIQHVLFGRHVPDMRFSNHNTGISRLDFDEGYVMLRYLNRIDHLPRDLVT